MHTCTRWSQFDMHCVGYKCLPSPLLCGYVVGVCVCYRKFEQIFHNDIVRTYATKVNMSRLWQNKGAGEGHWIVAPELVKGIVFDCRFVSLALEVEDVASK